MGRKPRIVLAEDESAQKQFVPPSPKNIARLYNPNLPDSPRVEELCAIAARFGLDPSGVGDFCRIVANGEQVAFVLGYRGILRLATQSGQVAFMGAYPVYSRDTFALDLGTQYVKHAPYDGEEDPGPLMGAYCLLLDPAGGKRIEYASGREIAAVAQRWWERWMPIAELARRLVSIKTIYSSPLDFGLLRPALDLEQRTTRGQEIPEYDTLLGRQ